MLIVVEGIDRIGKSTAIHALAETMRLEHPEKKVHVFRCPDRSLKTGALINDFLMENAGNGGRLSSERLRLMHLLFAANRVELFEKIENLIHDEDSIVILDRYWYSGFAYTMSQTDRIPETWMATVDEHLPRPDLIFYLRADRVNILRTRRDFGQERYEKIETLTEVQKNFDYALFQLFRHTYRHLSVLQIFETTDARSVAEEMYETCERLLKGTLDVDGSTVPPDHSSRPSSTSLRLWLSRWWRGGWISSSSAKWEESIQ